MKKTTKTHFGAQGNEDGNDDQACKKDTVDLFKPQNFADVLVEKFQKRSYPDIDIIIDGKRFRCHQMMLLCYSEYFRQIELKKQIELPSSEIPAKGFEVAYEYMLTNDEFDYEKFDLPQVMKAANFLQIDELLQLCWNAFYNPCMYDDYSHLILYHEAQKHDVHILKAPPLVRIGKAFLCLVASENYLNMDEETVAGLLKTDKIGVHSELQVLLAAVLWLSHDWPKREACILNVMLGVRFSLMTEQMYRDLESCEFSEKEMQLVFKSQNGRNALLQGMVELHAVRTGRMKPVDRCWLTDADGTIPDYCSTFEWRDKQLVMFLPFKKHLAEIKDLDDEFMDEVVVVEKKKFSLN